ncbi:MAG: DUF2163 domain-containing protein [Rhodobacteraceae bacterium]|nr:MAG: DUF2163 domain-containing protein [Paracoccaceae bacterium]
MRAVDAALQARLDGGATTLCRCWRIERRDGRAFGFTDHDAPLSFDGLTFEAASALDASAVERTGGLAPDNVTVAGALTSAAISAEEVAAGLFDGAAVTQWLVDWREPAVRHLTFRGRLAAIERGEAAFTAEVEGVSAPLDRPTGRAFLPECDAAFGDARCGIDAAAWTAEGVVASAEGARLVASGLEGFAAGWFARGRLAWLTGANAGLEAAVRADEGGGVLALWAPPVRPAVAGDAFAVTAGCDKRFETCRTRFGNTLNFRGFPHVPGDDWVAAWPREGEAHDGGSRYG